MDNPALLKKIRTEHFVGGEYVESVSRETFTALNPSTNQLIASFPLANSLDTDNAVEKAFKAFTESPWPKMAAKERAKILRKFAELIKQNADFLGTIESLNVGKLLIECVNHDVVRAAENLEFFANEIEKTNIETFFKGANFLGREVMAKSIVKREPVGVCALIVPWNSPLMLASWKIGPCLAAGNTCVIKPSPWAPLSILQLGELANEAGIPPGVINIIAGGKEAGETLILNPKISRVSFTGSVATGRAVNQANSKVRLAPISLELGGKAPNMVFKDADMKLAVKGVARSIFRSQGQSCIAGSRLLLEKPAYQDFMSELIKYVASLKIGDQFDPQSDIGPIITEEHLKRVLKYIRLGSKEGAQLTCGGKKPKNPELAAGNFLEPTIFTDVTPQMRIWREEIFGPVLAVTQFEREDEAIRLANDTPFGLSANIWTENIEKSMRVANMIDAGMIWINGHFIRDLRTPFGGRKESGSGSEGGRYSLEFYTQPKMICLIT